MNLIKLSSKSSASADYFNVKFKEISVEIKGFQAQIGERK